MAKRSRSDDVRLAALDRETGKLLDSRMRQAVVAELEPDESVVSVYSVGVHIWREAVLTDRALLLVMGVARARVERLPLPLEVVRHPTPARPSAAVVTSWGVKTLWGSKVDPECAGLVAAIPPSGMKAAWLAAVARRVKLPEATAGDEVKPPAAARAWWRRDTHGSAEAETPTRRPRRPRKEKVRRIRVGFPPASTVWELVDNCVKCGRPLTNPKSRQARVGTTCIKIYGSQQRRIENPEYGVWAARKARADADYAAARARADSEYEREMRAFRQAREAWRMRRKMR